MAFSTLSTVNRFLLNKKSGPPAPLAFYDVISTTNLICAYSFEPYTISSLNVGNLQTGSVVNDATITNAAAITTTTPKFGIQSLNFGYKLAIAKTFSFTTNGVSFSFWYKVVTHPSGGNPNGLVDITTNSQGATSRYYLICTGTGFPYRMQLYDFGSGWKIVYDKAGNASIADSTWHHYVCTITYGTASNSTLRFYVDNSLATTLTSVYYPGTTGNGTYTELNTPYNSATGDSKMACFRLYNRVLNTTEIGNLYTGGC